jgi:hypothetical protein
MAAIPNTGTDFTPNTGMAGGSPKTLYLFFLLNLCSRYFEVMRAGEQFDVDSATASLVAFCPDREKREALWKMYVDEKTKTNSSITASVLVVGDLISYLSEIMEFTEKSTGGFL